MVCAKFVIGGLYPVCYWWFVPSLLLVVCAKFVIGGLYPVCYWWFVQSLLLVVCTQLLVVCTQFVIGGLYPISQCTYVKASLWVWKQKCVCVCLCVCVCAHLCIRMKGTLWCDRRFLEFSVLQGWIECFHFFTFLFNCGSACKSTQLCVCEGECVCMCERAFSNLSVAVPRSSLLEGALKVENKRKLFPPSLSLSLSHPPCFPLYYKYRICTEFSVPFKSILF